MRLRFAVGCVFFIACQSQTKVPQKTEAPPAMPVAQAALPTACVGAVKTGENKTLQIGQTTWELNGSTLTQKSPANADQIVIGIVSDIKEDSPENLTNIKTLVAWFKQKHADVIVVDGDSGQSREQLINVLSALGSSRLPTFVTIGNRESTKDYKQAMLALASDYSNVVDLSVVRRIHTPQADFISMPGYFNAAYIHAVDGCHYVSSDIETLTELVKASKSPVVLVSHGGPRQIGELAIDRTSDQQNVGDPALADFIEKQHIPFGIFGNIHEAGGKATDLVGSRILPQNTWQTSMYLNPGPVDSVRWQMNDKTESVGMGAIMIIKDGKASYETKRLVAPKNALAAATHKSS
jgi:Icc-related predicted phosphoesterase